MPKDYYSTLGVGKNASDEDIKRAFRKLAHQYHPDKPGGNAEKFKEVNAAYQVLGDPEKRRRYDQFGSAAFEAGGGPGGFDFASAFGGGPGGVKFDFGDLGDVFGDIFGFGGVAGKSREERGGNIEMDLQLAFKEAAFGAEKTVSLNKNAACDSCDGGGAEPGTKIAACSDCGGSGRIRRVQQTILGAVSTSTTCPRCGGAGKAPEKRCRRCGGVGVVRAVKEISLKIPAGIDDGEVLRLSGEGQAGPRGGRSGDLYVTVRVKPDPRFRRDGFDVHGRRETTFVRAALGGTVAVPTLDGEVELKIPAGTQPGQVFRLKGKGVPFLKRSGRGDHYVEITVRVPEKLTREQRRILEEWGEM